jgi:hypothetical protein
LPSIAARVARDATGCRSTDGASVTEAARVLERDLGRLDGGAHEIGLGERPLDVVQEGAQHVSDAAADLGPLRRPALKKRRGRRRSGREPGRRRRLDPLHDPLDLLPSPPRRRMPP